MRRVATFVLAVLTLTAAARAQDEQLRPLVPAAPPSQEAVDETPSRWFVELQGTPIADGGSAATLAQEKQTFRAAAREAGVRLEERYSFDTLWNGFSLEVAPGDVAKLTRLPGFKALYPVTTAALPEPQPETEQALATALAQTQTDVARQELGLTGAGIRVAVIDSGIDYDHPDLGGCFGQGCRVEVGWDFVGDAYSSSASKPVPDALPDDCGGHGTHVAGIVGARQAVPGEGVEGVAPGVTFGAYRVFGCTGTTGSDVIVAAMERVLADGADVLNLSIGSGFQWPQFPTAQAADRLVRKGIVVVASIGNDGPRGLYAGGAPGVASKVIGVADFQHTHLNLPAFAVSPDDRLAGYHPGPGAPLPPFSGTYPLARTGTATSTADGCDAVAPAPGSLAGKIALIRRGTCGFHEKARNAQSAGAVGVVIYNNQAGQLNPSVVGPVAITIPVVGIVAADGVEIDSRLAAGNADLTWTARSAPTPNALANLISSSSSYGLAPDLSLKPDLGAPGGTIRSTIPLEAGTYGFKGGTSMASPHVAGAAALLLEARPNTPPASVAALLLNSAAPQLWWGNPATGLLDNVHRQGAGMVQIADAIRSRAKVEPAKLALGESEPGPAVRTLNVSNDGSEPVTYTLSHHPAVSTGPSSFTPSFFAGFATAAFSAPSVTVPAGGSAAVTVTLTANPSLPDRSIYGGYVVFTPQGGGTPLSVPYAGFKGDYQSIPVLTSGGSGFPWLSRPVGTQLVNQPNGATFTLQNGDLPTLAVHFDHPYRKLRVDIRNVDTGASWHQAIAANYGGRNSAANSIFSFSWDGTTVSGKKVYTVPDGRYVLVVSVQKALGDDANPAHWETWTSPIVTIDRP